MEFTVFGKPIEPCVIGDRGRPVRDKNSSAGNDWIDQHEVGKLPEFHPELICLNRCGNISASRFCGPRHRTGTCGISALAGRRGFAKVATAWFQWQLKEDKEAAKMFVGDPCRVAQMPGWKVEKKKIP
jgi:hypothetical protein